MLLRYMNTAEDLAAFSRFHTERRMTHRKAVRTIAETIVLIALFPCVVVGWIEDRSFPVLVGAGAGLATALLFLLLARRERQRSSRAWAEEPNPSLLCEHTLEVTPRGLIERTPVSESIRSRGGILRIEDTPLHVFIYTQVHAAYVIPKRAIPDGDREAFMAALRAFLKQPTGSPQPPAVSG